MKAFAPLFMSVFCFFILNFHSDAYAFGKKRKTETPVPQEVQSFPVRVVSMGQFYDTPFELPTGKEQVNMAAALPLVATTEMSASGNKLRPTAPGSELTRYVFRGGITTFDAEMTKFGIKFGWKPGVGDIGNGKLDVKGSVNVKVNQLGMDFFIEDTVTHQVVVAKNENIKQWNTDVNVTVDFADFQSVLDFVYSGPFSELMRKMIRNIVDKMIKDPQMNFLMDWQSQIALVDYDLKKIYFNNGLQDGIALNNVFTVYDGLRRIGEVKITSTDVLRSEAQFKNDDGDRLLHAAQEGDPIKIYYLNVPK